MRWHSAYGFTSFRRVGNCLALGLLGLVAACGGGHDARPEAPATPSFADALRPKIIESISKNSVPGAVVVVKSRQGNWTEAFGDRSRGGGGKVDAGDYFRIGSITKTWTGTVVLQLAQEGRLKLGDPISAYVPNVPNGTRITIEQLLNMRSGLFNYTEDPGFVLASDTQPEKVYTDDELLAIAFSHAPLFDPGARFYYSNTNTFLLGMVIEKLTGTSVAEQINARLFKSQGLERIFMPEPTDTRLPPPFARGYQYGTNRENGDERLMAEAERNALRRHVSMLVDQTDTSTSWARTAGMGISTAEDLARFARKLVGGGYLRDDLQKQRLASCLPTDPANQSPDALHYGWGIGRLGKFYGHNGQIPGYNAVMLHDPVGDTTVVVLTSLSVAKGGVTPGDEIGEIITRHFD